MSLAPKVGFSSRPARVGGRCGALGEFGGLVDFDTLASAFIGCFI